MRRFAYEFEAELVNIEIEIEQLERKEELTKREKEHLENLRKAHKEIFKRTYENLTPWQKVQLARHPYRPTASFYISRLFSDFQPINSDRRYPDDPSIVCGFAKYKNIEVVVAAVEKGADSRERQRRRFGMPLPEGYYKFIRALDIAESLKMPVITFVDTPGAYPGIEAEERGQALAIARAIKKMLFVKVPTVSIIIGEGGSGGAIALACANRIYILENAYYSVISPEGCASILFHDEKMAPAAAAILKLTAEDLLNLGLVHGIVKEPFGSAYRNPEQAAKNVDSVLEASLAELVGKNIDFLIEERIRFFMNMEKIRK